MIPALDECLTCRRCRRLTHQFKKLRVEHPDYWNQPVPGYGPVASPMLIMGLAPGKHGANKTGVPFTGDASGEMLHRVLNRLDMLDKVRISNAVKCLPVKNHPTGKEVANCRRFLIEELNALRQQSNPVVFALGGIAHRAIIAALKGRQADHPFAHEAVHQLEQLTIVDSYHCSRYNTQTGRLTEPMFESAVRAAATRAFPNDGI